MVALHQTSIKENSSIKGDKIMAKYYRITAYWPEKDISVIIDSNGMFERLYEFSEFVSNKGVKIQEVSSGENMLDGNIDRAEENLKKLIIQAADYGRPKYAPYVLRGKEYKGVQVDDKIYVPNKNQ